MPVEVKEEPSEQSLADVFDLEFMPDTLGQNVLLVGFCYSCLIYNPKSAI